MRDTVKSAIYRRIDRAVGAAALMPPASRHSLEREDERSASFFTGRKRKQPPATPPMLSSETDVVDLTDDNALHTHTHEVETPVKRQRLTPSEDSARPPTSRSDSVAPLDTSQKKSKELERSPRTASAPTGLLSPEITPQKQREQYESLHFADSAYATSGEVASLVEARNKHSGDVVQRSTEMASDSVVDSVNKSEHPQSPDTPKSAALRRSDSSRHSFPAATGGDTSANQIPGSTLSSTERMDAAPLEPVVTSAPETPDQVQSDARPLTENPQTSEDVPLSSLPLHQIPEIASRLIPKTSTAENIEYTNPQKFSLKPPYWKRWTRSTMPASPSTCNLNSTHSLSLASRISPWTSMSTGLRTWTMRANGKKAFAEVVGVGKGAVVLLLENEKRPTIKVDLLIDEDAAYLRTVLSKKDMAVLWPSP
ncbi:hypothetical protein LTR12_017165 [Friedmanniomyces endolithicus]|nr:hypothetical protein LTR12_017165 [Friedmanniomyces endolithicus]